MGSQSFEEVKKSLFAMAGLVEQSVISAITGIEEKSFDHLKKVDVLEKQINQYHKKLDDLCFRYIALQGPVARDLRYIIATIKTNSDLERMGDQAVNLAETADYLLKQNGVVGKELSEMFIIVKQMLKGAFDSFQHDDMSSIDSINLQEKKLNQLKKDVFLQQLITIDSANKTSDPFLRVNSIEQILISRNVERLGDHASNILENYLFIETGEDIRHQTYKP